MLNKFLAGLFPVVMVVFFLEGASSNLDELTTTVPEASSARVQETTPDQSYIGMAKCITCHRKHGDMWSETKHSQAFEHLPAKYRDDSSCLKCHLTAFGEPGGFTPDMTAEEAQPFQSVGCESCHGPGAVHAEAVKAWTLADPADEERLEKEMNAAILKTPTDSQCAVCHKTQVHQVHPPYEGQPLQRVVAAHSNITTTPEILDKSPHSYSVKTCGSCHYEQYKRWRFDAHAELSTGLPAKYENDQNCLTCHRKSGEALDWYAAETDPQANTNTLGVGCEFCHGSALKHVQFNKQNISRLGVTPEIVKSTRELMRKEKLGSACLQCHVREGHKEHAKFDKPDVSKPK